MKRKTVTIKGIRGKCISCEEVKWLHPELDMCGTCTTGKADDLELFKGLWEETVTEFGLK